MSKFHFTIADHMTAHPHGVNLKENLQKAHEIMTKDGFRHLPVIDEGKVVGILSERDIQVAKGFKHSSLKNMEVEDIYEDSVYITHPDANLKHVAATMADKRIGSAVVVDDKDALVGIFTTTDACRILNEVLG
ncbi:MAG: CBS domain-containing protein [Deltaproteobacteria bacterium]|nr:CBS domain-containing protein [Deltaproteobacteria bacterium]